MSDRTNANLFGLLFQALASHVETDFEEGWEPDPDGDDVTVLALNLLALAQGYDFSYYQMQCDDALARLGLARPGNEDNYEYVECPASTEMLPLYDVLMFPPILRNHSGH
jgi:hypothetical protein